MSKTNLDQVTFRLSKCKHAAFLKLLEPSNVVQLALVRLLRSKPVWDKPDGTDRGPRPPPLG